MTQDEIIRMAREAGLLAEDEVWVSPHQEAMERFAALVAEPWIETNKALAKEIIELQKQAEQEPVAFQAREIGEGDWFDVGLDEVTRITGIINSPHIDYRWLYAAHVRTKDLTDDEIRFWIGRFPFLLNEESEKWVIGLARVIIAADREKNK